MILWISQILIPFMVCYITGFGLLSGRPVFDDFLEGAKSGMKTAAGLLPVFVGLMTAVGVMRSSGLLEALGKWLSIPAGWLHLPAELVPITLVRLVSNSAATGLLLDLFEKSGPDSPLGMCASVMMSCTETVFIVSAYTLVLSMCGKPVMPWQEPCLPQGWEWRSAYG